MDQNNYSKILTIGMSITLIICILGLLLICLIPGFNNSYLQIAFLAFAGTSLGSLLGQYSRHKRKFTISRNIFFRILVICLSCVGVSIGIYLILHDRGLLSILALNTAGLGLSIGMLTKKTRRLQD